MASSPHTRKNSILSDTGVDQSSIVGQLIDIVNRRVVGDMEHYIPGRGFDARGCLPAIEKLVHRRSAEHFIRQTIKGKWSEVYWELLDWVNTPWLVCHLHQVLGP